MTKKDIRTSKDWDDQNLKRVLSALSNPKWDFRTTTGISKETGLSELEVSEILKEYPQFIRKSLVPDGEGHEQFTHRERPIRLQEYLASARMFVAKSIH
jgi:hypothetical protein